MPESKENIVDPSNLREVERVILLGLNLRTMAQFKMSHIAEQVREVSTLICEAAGDKAPEVAFLLASDAQSLVRSSGGKKPIIDVAVARALDLLDCLYGEKPAVEQEKTVENKGRQGSRGKGKGSKGSGDKPKSEPAGKTADTPVEPKDPKDIAVGQLKIDQEVLDKLLDLGIGTAVQILEFNDNAGLSTVIGDDATAKVLQAVEEARKPSE